MRASRGARAKVIDVLKLAEEIRQRAREAANEEELRMGFVTAFAPILESLGIRPSYEKRPVLVVSGGRTDALYRAVIIEFRSPGKLGNEKELEDVAEQVKGYVRVEAPSPEHYGRYFGAVTDGLHITFIKYRRGAWERTGLLELNEQTISKLVEALRGLGRKPLDAALLLRDFGPESDLSRRTILALYRALLNPRSARTGALFEDWKRVFSQVCAYSREKLKGLMEYYGLSAGNINAERLMFSIHTYYAMLVKLLASEIVTLYADSLIGSYLKKLEEAYQENKNKMLEELRNLEEGGLFAELGIKNFLEADYFAWYLDEWNDDIASVVYDIVKKLMDYEPGTIELSPERIRDLFKRLYQGLVPRKIRHDLGEYFTPDWLAELVLDEVGYDGDPDKGVLDPACGSGTFLVLAIKRIKERAEEHFIDKRELLEKIVKNVRGTDLNPLAVLAAKANYIITIADLLRYRPGEGIEIPVYLADSVAVGRRAALFGEEIYLKTVEGEFWVPREVLDGDVLSRVLDDIEFCLRNRCSRDEFKKLINKNYRLTNGSVESLARLYDKLAGLEKEGENGTWTRILKNSFAPLLIGKFDYVIGNPPWINWENLPESYRNDTKPLWDQYGLLEGTREARLGKVKRDISMLFVARCLDMFTKDGGKLAFLVPFTVYRTQAGAGFRKFLTNYCRVLRIHDLVALRPFEGAASMTSLIVIEKAGRTEFPIPCITWHNPGTTGIGQEAELEEVRSATKRLDAVLIPIEEGKPESPWMQITEKAYEAMRKVIGSSPWYKAYEGVNTALNQVYWVEVIDETPSGLLITNPQRPRQKKKVKQVKQVVEKELVYPLVRGRDVKRWFAARERSYIIIPHDPNTGKPIEEGKLKAKYPNTYEYFNNFRELLENRSLHKLWGRGNPFYSVYDIGEYTFSPYKVVWKYIAGGSSGKAELSAAVIGGVIPDSKLMLIPFSSEKEAHYVCSVLNSSVVRLIVASYAISTAISTHVTERIRIPKYDPNNLLHLRLSGLSERAHQLAEEVYWNNREELREKLREVEEEIDKGVAKLYGVTDEELGEVKKCLAILKGGRPSDNEEEAS